MEREILLLANFENFTGVNNQSWGRWYRRFRAKTIAFSEENRLQGLVSLLQDGALDYFASLSEEVQSNLQQTVAALEARFGTAKSVMRAHAELASIRQQPGEATRDFADRVRQTGREAYPGAAAGDPAVEATVVSRFVGGLREEQLRVRVLTKDPASLIEAVKAADKFERQQDALRAMRPPTGGEAMAVQDRDAPGTARLDALERIIGELQRALQALETAGRRDAYRTGHGTGARNPQRGPPNPNRRGFDKWRHWPAPVAPCGDPVERDGSGTSQCEGGQPSSGCVEDTVTSNGSEAESASRCEGGSPAEARTTSRPGVDGDAGDASPVEWSGKQKAQEERPTPPPGAPMQKKPATRPFERKAGNERDFRAAVGGQPKFGLRHKGPWGHGTREGRGATYRVRNGVGKTTMGHHDHLTPHEYFERCGGLHEETFHWQVPPAVLQALPYFWGLAEDMEQYRRVICSLRNLRHVVFVGN
ncbi:hypothetical protein FJT64_012667 [Amphibalanus amphitrite]|uniref:Retrotransposon gag domain-containing protein n=1 Tax=Amphibalanus amphitrite TaxID=1232801 RepID=A0A6A4UYR6_AMPAM|nr:hypothetical protein FJT64_012667 [Amphibalanus amphitrite]